MWSCEVWGLLWEGETWWVGRSLYIKTKAVLLTSEVPSNFNLEKPWLSHNPLTAFIDGNCKRCPAGQEKTQVGGSQSKLCGVLHLALSPSQCSFMNFSTFTETSHAYKTKHITCICIWLIKHLPNIIQLKSKRSPLLTSGMPPTQSLSSWLPCPLSPTELLFVV
jgi:hypothetical protein